MPGASFEAITGRLGIGAIAFLGIVPTVVVTYIVGVFCLGVAEAVLSGLSSLASTKPEDIIAVSATGSALLQQLYSEHLRNHELLKGATVSFFILAMGCIAETPKLGYNSPIGWLFTAGAIALAVLSLLFARGAAGRAATIAQAAYLHCEKFDLPNPRLKPTPASAAALHGDTRGGAA